MIFKESPNSLTEPYFIGELRLGKSPLHCYTSTLSFTKISLSKIIYKNYNGSRCYTKIIVNYNNSIYFTLFDIYFFSIIFVLANVLVLLYYTLLNVVQKASVV